MVDRRSRFEERVRVERLFLEPLNRRFGAYAPLAGMTGIAIDNWIKRACEVNDKSDVERIGKLLVEASSRAALLADNSRDVFEKVDRGTPDGLERLASLLQSQLTTLDPHPNPR